MQYSSPVKMTNHKAIIFVKPLLFHELKRLPKKKYHRVG